MEINMIGHGCKMSVEQILMLFFSRSEDISVQSELSEADGIATVRTELRHNLETAESVYTEAIDFTNEKSVRDIVKKSTFLAAKKLSGRKAPWGILTGIRPAKIATDMMAEGMTEQEIRARFQNDYWTEEEKIDLTLTVAKREYEILKQAEERKISIYIGIPFCPTRCLYCSFVSTSMEYLGHYLPDYIACLKREIQETAEIIRRLGFEIETVYFGGGTPTTLSADALREVLSEVEANFDLSRIKEYTVEAGRPDTVTPEKLAVLKEYGVDRLSINPQTMHQATLNQIGRKHTPEDIVRAFRMAREAGFQNINSDVIAGLPYETPEMFRQTLSALTPLAPESITVHTMYLKRASRLKEELGKYRLTEADTVGEMLEIADSYMKQHEYLPYYMYKQKNTLGNHENVGYAKEGHHSLYNINMMEEIQTVLGLGGGGVTKIVKNGKIDRIFNMKNADEYVRRIDEMLERKRQIYSYFDEVRK